MSKRVILYCRVSSDEQKKEGLSLEHQERALRSYCDSHGYEIINERFWDDYSAKDYDLQRLEIKRIYEYLGGTGSHAMLNLLARISACLLMSLA